MKRDGSSEFAPKRGRAFRNGHGFSEDPVDGFNFLSEAYNATDPSFDGRVTVPVLWDKETRRIVSNSDDDLLRMLNSEFSDFTANDYDFYPADLCEEISYGRWCVAAGAVNAVIDPLINYLVDRFDPRRRTSSRRSTNWMRSLGRDATC